MIKALKQVLTLPKGGGSTLRDVFWTGAGRGILSFVVLVFACSGYYFETGLPRWFMALLWAVLGWLAYQLLVRMVWLTGHFLMTIPSVARARLLGAMISLGLAFSAGFYWPAGFYALVCLGCLAGAVIWFGGSGILRTGHVVAAGKKVPLIGILSFILLLAAGGVYWLWQEGTIPPGLAEDLPLYDTGKNGSVPVNPAEEGDFKHTSFTYGSGTDKRRPEFGGGVRFQTPAVDASRLLPEWKGWKKKWREQYWKFDVAHFPLNARVWMPEGQGPFPIVLIVHGNHDMIDYSDGGYAYLGEWMASRGMIAVSVDENFVNAHWSGDFRGKEMPVRAWLLLKHLEQWRNWNLTPGHELAGKADLDRVILIGHSRGGEAVSIAAAFNRLSAFPDQALERFDFHFGIRGVIAIAPTDYRYHRRVKLKDVNYLALQGSWDVDETSFWGLRQYQRIQFSRDSDFFKAGVYLHRANHGQFNTTWGRHDFSGPVSWLLNTGPILEGTAQRASARVFIGAFLEKVLHGREEYLEFFKNANQVSGLLPGQLILTNYFRSGATVLAGYETDLDPSTGEPGVHIRSDRLKIWQEVDLVSRDDKSLGNHAVVLGWDYGEQVPADSLASYSLLLSDTFSRGPDAGANLMLAIAVGDPAELEKATERTKASKNKEKRKDPRLDFTVMLVDSAGRKASLAVGKVKPVKPRLKVQFMKTGFLDEEMDLKPWEVALESFFLPLGAFEKIDTEFDLATLREIKFLFDLCPYGVVYLDEVGFSK